MRRGTSLFLILMTALIAVSGYFREVVVAHMYGTSSVSDAFYFSLVLAQTVHDLIFGGALIATVIPLLHKTSAAIENTTEQTRSPLARSIASLIWIVAISSILVAAGLSAGLNQVIRFVAPDLTEQVRPLALSFAYVLIWTIPVNALMTLLVLVLNSLQHFRLASLAPLLSNLVFIATVYAAETRMGVASLPFASIAGPLAGAALMILGLARLGFLRPFRLELTREFARALWQQAGPLVLSFGFGSVIGLLMISQLIARAYAAGHGTGAIAALGYAFRLYELPISILVNPATTILFTLFAQLHAAGKKSEIARLTRDTLTWGLLLLSPVAAIVAFGAEPIVELVLQRGKFDAAAALLTAEALRGFAPAIIAESVFIVFFRLFYVIDKAVWTVWISIISIATLVCFLQLTNAGPFSAVSLSVSASFAVVAASIFVLLMKRFGRIAMPALGDMVRWLLAFGGSILVYQIAHNNLAPNLIGKLFGLFTLAVSYSALIAILFTEHLRHLWTKLRT